MKLKPANPSKTGARRHPARTFARNARLGLEPLESRLTPYSVSGNLWPQAQLITISFVPDGTQINGYSSNLFATMNAKFGSAATWQNQILKAAQQWAQQTNINFALKADNGDAGGSGDFQQGDPNFGDIRISGYNFGTSTLAQAYLPPPVNNYSIAGDFQFNTGRPWNIGSTYDLYTVAMHEFGHALGLYHTPVTGTAMNGTYTSALAGLGADDIAGIRNIYSGNAARGKDAYDAFASNETSATARVITSSINTTTNAGVINNLDLTTSTDVDWYKFIAPLASSSTLRVKVQSAGISLLNPKVEVYNSAVTLLASGVAGAYGGTASATASGIVAGQTYYVKVSSTDMFSAAFKTGRYSLILNMGTEADPSPTYTGTQLANGTPLSGGGGEAVVLDISDNLVNSMGSSVQQTSGNGHRTVATDSAGNFVVTWASQNQDGSGWGVYARRFDSNGVALGSEFRVNTTTASDQGLPTVARNASGAFVIAWTSQNQDGNGLGVYAQRYSSGGVAQGAEFRVNTFTADDQTDPSVAIDNGGNFVVTWSSLGQDGSGWGVYAQRYDSNGAALGSEFRVNSTAAADQTDPSVAMDPVGNFVIAWTSAGQDGSGLGIYAQRYSALGIILGLEFRGNSTTAGDQSDSAVCIGKSGNFTIVWASQGQDGSGWSINAQRYASLLLGLPLGGEIQCNTTTAGAQVDPSVAADSNGNAFVTWNSYDPDGFGWEVRGQLLEGLSGAKKEAEFGVNLTKAGDQRYSSVAVSNLGQAVVAWSGNGSGDSTGVYVQRFDMTRDSYHAVDDPCCGCKTCVSCSQPAQSAPPEQMDDPLAVRLSSGAATRPDFLGLLDLDEGRPSRRARDAQVTASSVLDEHQAAADMLASDGDQDEGSSEDTHRPSGRGHARRHEDLSDDAIVEFEWQGF